MGKGLKITSLNVQGSLSSRLADLEKTKAIYRNSDIICLQETGRLGAPVLEGYICKHVGGGHKCGVAVFIKEEMAARLMKTDGVGKEFFQCLKLSFDIFDVITIYSARNQPKSSFQDFVDVIKKGLDANKPTILCGDFNFDRKEENELTKMLRNQNFKQIVREPTTFRGYCIDHVYHNIPEKGEKVVLHKLYYPYYSDHEAVCIRIPVLARM